MSIESSLSVINEYNAAWERGDRDAGIALYAEDLIVHMGGVGQLAGVYRGRESWIRDWVERVAAYTDTWDVSDDKEFLLIGDDGVLLLVHVVWTRGGRRLETDRLALYRIDDGRIVECRYSDMRQAEVDAFFDEIS
jgi:ketosteroid isomerase-like protein